jgi:NSS family neurotransmitter:Na+ symporter
VVTQFVIQKMRISRKKAAVIPMVIAAVVSVLVSLSLGGHFTVIGRDLLTVFDEMTNTVLMPLCALAAALVVGWGIKTKEMADNIYPGKPLIGTMISYMVKSLTPLLILVVAVFGMVSNVINDGSYWYIIGAAFLLALIAFAVYYVFFMNKETGCNADELDLAE